MAHSTVFLDDQITGVSRLYQRPIQTLSAHSPSEVPAAFNAIERALAKGYYVAGYGAYELGYALDDKLAPLLPKSHFGPLLQFGVFENYAANVAPLLSAQSANNAPLPYLTAQWGEADYLARFKTLMAYIEAGDIYQANLTFAYRGHSEAPLDLGRLYHELRGRQPVRYGAIVELGETAILSLSPELFFAVKGGNITARPMKGTAARGDGPEQDKAIAAAMLADEKSRAENLMIVDLLRNDLSKVSKPSSVKVTDLFSLETYPTLHQMTSGISAKLRADIGPAEVFSSLFPCGSITGAPKIRAMEIIAQLEDRPRGPYCGAIGYFDPDGNASFNVAIRTLTSRKSPRGGFDVEYNVGSGVVYDSVGADEYAECQLKAAIVTRRPPIARKPRALIETLLWTPEHGFAYLEGHMIRLMRSADALGHRLDLRAVMGALDDAMSGKAMPQRVRLSLGVAGDISVTRAALGPTRNPLRLRLSKHTANSQDKTLRHKTSPLPFYDRERARLKTLENCDELIFINERGELTEGSYTNIFLSLDGQLYSPPMSSGLLAGVLRAELVARGEVKIKTLYPRDIKRANAVYVGNSVRGLCPAKLKKFDKI